MFPLDLALEVTKFVYHSEVNPEKIGTVVVSQWVCISHEVEENVGP